MADYNYLLQTRLTHAQFAALSAVREVAREKGVTVFLVGGTVRDLTAGFAVRDLDFAMQGNVLKLKKDFQKAGFTLVGEYEPAQTLYFSFPGGVRLEVGSALSVTYPKPGKPKYEPAAILEDLRRRDFTANAMALSLNEGSYGLLMDPLNGVADIENMELRLVSNYGFIEDPVRMIRGARLIARLGWQFEEKTAQRYETGKTEGYISAMSPWQRGYELEEIIHEEDPIRTLRKLEAEGWMKALDPHFTAAKVNENELNKLRDALGQLQSAGIHPDSGTAYFPLVTAKLAPKEVAELKKSFPRPGFVEAIEALDAQAKAFGTEFSGKAAATPSAAWKMLYDAVPEQVLWLAYSSKSAPVQARFKSFFTEWPTARQRIPYQTMQEMRITPELPIYAELMDKLFFALMDGQLETPEAIKAFLEPYSPPAPPPPPSLRRRAMKKESKSKSKKKAKAEEPAAVPAEAVVPMVEAAAPVTPAPEPKVEPVAKPAKVAAKKPEPPAAKLAKATPAPAKKAVAPVPAKKAAPVKAVTKAPAKKVAKPAPKPVAKKAAPAKKAVKVAPKKAAKVVAKKVAAKKPAPKPVAKKAAVKKPVAKKAAPKKAAKKR